MSTGVWSLLEESVVERGEGGINITMFLLTPAQGPRSTAAIGLYQALIQVIDAMS